MLLRGSSSYDEKMSKRLRAPICRPRDLGKSRSLRGALRYY